MPRPALYGAVLGGSFLLIGTLTVCAVLRTRETSRRTQATDNLKEIGIGSMQMRQYFPTIDGDDFPGWMESESREIEQAGP